MAEVFRSFDEPIRHSTGTYTARVVGRLAEDGMWEGWFEFEALPPGTSELIVSSAESRQPGRDTLEYWATGLSAVYVEGALDRAIHPLTVRARVAETAASSAPAPRVVTVSPG